MTHSKVSQVLVLTQVMLCFLSCVICHMQAWSILKQFSHTIDWLKFSNVHQVCENRVKMLRAPKKQVLGQIWNLRRDNVKQTWISKEKKRCDVLIHWTWKKPQSVNCWSIFTVQFNFDEINIKPISEECQCPITSKAVFVNCQFAGIPFLVNEFLFDQL